MDLGLRITLHNVTCLAVVVRFHFSLGKDRGENWLVSISCLIHSISLGFPFSSSCHVFACAVHR